jgi:hypothetical protein
MRAICVSESVDNLLEMGEVCLLVSVLFRVFLVLIQAKDVFLFRFYSFPSLRN